MNKNQQDFVNLTDVLEQNVAIYAKMWNIHKNMTPELRKEVDNLLLLLEDCNEEEKQMTVSTLIEAFFPIPTEITFG